MKAGILEDIKEGFIPDPEKLDPLIKNIIPDLIMNPYTKRFNFFMDCINDENEMEVYDVYNLLLSGISEEKAAEVSPVFKDFLNSLSNSGITSS
jgi:hypothetical protein